MSTSSVIDIGAAELAIKITDKDYKTISDLLFCLATRLENKPVAVSQMGNLDSACMLLKKTGCLLQEIQEHYRQAWKQDERLAR